MFYPKHLRLFGLGLFYGNWRHYSEELVFKHLLTFAGSSNHPDMFFDRAVLNFLAVFLGNNGGIGLYSQRRIGAGKCYPLSFAEFFQKNYPAEHALASSEPSQISKMEFSETLRHFNTVSFWHKWNGIEMKVKLLLVKEIPNDLWLRIL